jgi:hypothetical protein
LPTVTLPLLTSPSRQWIQIKNPIPNL